MRQFPCRGREQKQKTFQKRNKTGEKRHRSLSFMVWYSVTVWLLQCVNEETKERGDMGDSHSQSLLDKIARITQLERGIDNSIPDKQDKKTQGLRTLDNY